jgi:hypothetical protein
VATQPDRNDFLAWTPQIADEYLLRCRKATNSLGPTTVPDGAIVLLVALDGASPYVAQHGETWKLFDFASHCRRILKEHGAILVPPGADGAVDHATLAWFPPEEPAAPAAAAVKIHAHFGEINMTDKPSWVHEKHALVGIGRSEYAAFRLLQMAVRSTTVIDPVIWNMLSTDLQALLLALRAGPPDVVTRREKMTQVIEANVESMHKVVRVAASLVPKPAPAREPVTA